MGYEVNEGFVNVDSRELFYKVEGKGPSLIIPSYIGSTAFERHLSSNLREHLQLIFLDQAGVEGLSEPRPLSEISMNSFMDEIEAVRKSLDLEQICVLGHSGCGPLALEYALRYPDKISHLVLTTNLGPVIDWNRIGEHDKKHWEKYASKDRKSKLEKNILRYGETTFLTDFVEYYRIYSPKFWYDIEFDSSYLWDGLKFNQEAIQHIFQNVFNDFDVTEQLSEIECPVLLITCLYDFACPPSLWDGYKEGFKDCTYHQFTKCGHNPMVEIPEEFDNLIINWTKKRPNP